MGIIAGPFVPAALCEIGGGYPVWGRMREQKPLSWALIGAVVLASYGVVAALQPIPHFGRVYAACGGIFVVMAPAWGVLIEGFGPEGWDILGASVALLGALIMVAAPRG